MPSLPFKSKTSSSSKPSRSPAGGSVSPEPFVAGFPSSEEQWSAAHQYLSPSEGRPVLYAQGLPPLPNHAPHHPFDRPPVDVAASVNAGQPPPVSESQGYRQSYPPEILSQQQANPSSQESKRGFRERLFGSHPHSSDPSHNSGKLPSRRASIRRKEPPSDISSPAEDSSRKSGGFWTSRHSSSGNLPVSLEADEERHTQHRDPRVQQFGPHGASQDVPAHLQAQHQRQSYPEAKAPQPYTAQGKPLLHRVNTDHSSTSLGGQEFYSASDYSGDSSQHTVQQQEERLPSHLLHPHQAQQFQSFPPPSLQPSQGPRHESNPSVTYHQQQQQPPQVALLHAQAQNQDLSRAPGQQLPRDLTIGGSVPLDRPPPYQFGPPGSRPDIKAPNPQRFIPQAHSQAETPSQLQIQSPPVFVHPAPPSPVNPNFQPAQDRPVSPANPPSLSEEDITQQQPQQQPQQQQQRSGVSLQPSPLYQGTESSASKLLRKAADMPSQSGQGAAAGGKFGRPHKEEGDLGRSTPPPQRTGDLSEEEINQYNQLVKEHKELRDKYQKVKKYYFEKEAQVHSLQNAVANQRMSQSRTSLDDSEYAGRFSRLDGLISQLAFSIRKDWKTLPQWLQTSVNKDAITIGRQEMTACGRAFISQWLVEKLFDAYFHSDLEPAMSAQLKQIQHNIRNFAPPSSSEDEEALQAKVIAWRLATVDGLQDELRSQHAYANRQKLIETMNEQLIANLSAHLQEPAPPDLKGGVHMIIELSVGLASHLPMESREVSVEYYQPGALLKSDVMKIESGIPPLRIEASDDAASGDLKDAAPTAEDGSSGAKEDAKKGRGMLGGLMGARKPPPAGPPSKSAEASGSQTNLAQQRPGSASGGRDERAEPKVRIAVGMAVYVRGRNVLWKAPVYSTG